MELSLAPSGHSSTTHTRIVGGSSVLHWERLFVSFSQVLSLKNKTHVQYQSPVDLMTLASYMVQLYSYLCHINSLNCFFDALFTKI